MRPKSKNDYAARHLDRHHARVFERLHDIRTGWPLILVILFSWGIAFFEYCLTVPANRIGFNENGGPFNLMQLKIIQEVISLTIFTIIVTFLFKGQPVQWNHIAAFVCLILAVFFVFLK